MRKRRIPRGLVSVLLTCSLLGAAEHHGVVKFAGLPLPGASVTASQGEKKLATITDPQGYYSFADLEDGLWTIRVEMLCFEPAQREIALAPNVPAPDWELKMLPFDEIKAAAPPPPPSVATPAATESARAGAPAGKPAPAPSSKKGVPPPTPANTKTGFQRTDVNAAPDAGRAANENTAVPAPGEVNQAPSEGLLINGSVNNGAASPFAQSAAFGNNRRGPRSLYNGSLGMNLRSSTLDARTYSLTGQDTPKPGYRHVTGLAAFGGPLRIPHLLLRRGPNVTATYQWTRNRNANNNSVLMPTLEERNGDLSNTLNPQGQRVTIFDPSNGQPFAGNVIPRNRISSEALALLRLYPAPNFDSGSNFNYQIPLVGSMHQDSLQARGNKSIGNKNGISGAFALQSTRSDNTNIFGFLNTTGATGVNANINWMHRFTSRIFLNSGVQFSRFSNRVTPFFANRENISGQAGITGNNQEPANWGPPGLNFAGGIAGLSDVQWSSNHNQTTGVSGSLFWARGAHNLTFGGALRRLQFNQISQQDPRGTFTFTGAAAGNDFAGFLLGIPDTSAIAFGNADKYLRSGSYDAFFTDDWRFSPSLTINWGGRWEYNSPITERYGRLVNLDIAPGFSAIAPVLASSASGTLTGKHYPASLLHPDKQAFQPRIGISWRPLLASSMIVRAGYGVYYDTSVYMPIVSRMTQQSPFSKSSSVQNSALNPLTLANGFSTPPSLIPNTFAVDPDFQVGYSQNWQVSVQRDLPRSLVMTATYLGIKGTRAQQQFLPNTFPAGAVNPCPSCPAGFAYLTSNGNSTRHSGTVQLRRRLHNGFTASLQYTYSKAIDNAALGGTNQGGALIAQDWLNLSGERGRSNFDQRHLLNATIQYTTGMGIGGGTLMAGWKGGLFKDWTFATQIASGTGLPLTPVYPAAVRGTGMTGSIRPDYTGVSLYAASGGRFLNPAAVAAPAPGRWGNAGRNSITGPGQFSLNGSMARTFRISDRVNADFRLDAMNALNHPVYPSWNVTITSAQFGLPMTVNPMRNVQSTLRVRF